VSDPFADMAADLAADEDMGELVTYEGGGLASPTDIPIVWLDQLGLPFEGPGNTVRTISADILYASVRARPGKNDRLTRKNGSVWKPQQVQDIDAIATWRVTLEKVS
jgi:hypothetical protein